MKYLFFSALTGLMFSCTLSSNNKNLEINSEAYADSVKQASVINNNTTNEAAKTDSEVLADAALDVIAQAKELAAAKRKSDSAKFANRAQVWVYQIGLPKNSEAELWSTYERIKGFGNVYAFRQSRNTYLLIKNDFYTEQQLTDSLYHFNTLLNSVGVSDIATPYNLMTECKLKETVVHCEDLKIKKKQVIGCLVCD